MAAPIPSPMKSLLLLLMYLLLQHINATAQCNPPAGLATTFVSCDSVKFKWTATGSGKFYDYCVDQVMATPPAQFPLTVTGSPATGQWGGLHSSDVFYIHMRTNCAGVYSSWETISFNTPRCEAPRTITITPSTTKVLVKWNMGCAKEFEYVLDMSPYNPGTSGTVVQDDSVVLTGLTPKTQYFIHIRSKCDSLGFPVYSPWTAGKAVALASSGTGVAINAGDAKEISVYPNPVNDMLYIDVLSAVVPAGMIELCTVDGRILKRQDRIERTNVIDTKALSPGLYFLRYYNGQTVQVIKLIRQ